MYMQSSWLGLWLGLFMATSGCLRPVSSCACTLTYALGRVLVCSW